MLFVAVAVAVFFWAVKSEQFDDLDRQSVSILFDEEGPAPTPTNDASIDSDRAISAEVTSLKSGTDKEHDEITEKPLNKSTPLD